MAAQQGDNWDYSTIDAISKEPVTEELATEFSGFFETLAESP